MRQRLIHVEEYYTDDFMRECQQKIDEFNAVGWKLVDFKFSHLEDEGKSSSSYLLFEECE